MAFEQRRWRTGPGGKIIDAVRRPNPSTAKKTLRAALFLVALLSFLVVPCCAAGGKNAPKTPATTPAVRTLYHFFSPAAVSTPTPTAAAAAAAAAVTVSTTVVATATVAATTVGALVAAPPAAAFASSLAAFPFAVGPFPTRFALGPVPALATAAAGAAAAVAAVALGGAVAVARKRTHSAMIDDDDDDAFADTPAWRTRADAQHDGAGPTGASRAVREDTERPPNTPEPGGFDSEDDRDPGHGGSDDYEMNWDAEDKAGEAVAEVDMDDDAEDEDEGTPALAAAASADRPVDRKPMFPCVYAGCTFSATSKPGLQAHIRRKHTFEKPFACTYPGCQYRTVTASALTQHTIVHKDVADLTFFKCDFANCTFETPRKGHLATHKKTAHSLTPLFACPDPGCDYTCNFKINLKTHIERMHTVNPHKPHVCDFPGCSYASDSRDHLNVHKRVHTGEKPYVCDWPGCSFSANQSGLLSSHKLRVHSGQKPYVCDEPGCAYKTADLSTFKRHVFAHTGVKPIKCELGDYATAHRRNFRSHMDAHTGVRPFICTWAGCDYRSARKCDLNLHTMTHTGERPFVCTVPWCDYASTTTTSLKYHTEAYHTADGLAGRGKDERGVASALEAAGFAFKREHRIYTDCLNPASTYSRIDFVLGPMGPTNTMVFLEVDEHAHAGYAVSCEVRRMADVTGSAILEGNTLPIAWIRFNPHDFRVDGALHRPAKRDRYAALIARLHELALATSARPVTIEYMYYDMTLGRPAVLRHDDYKAEVRKWVL